MECQVDKHQHFRHILLFLFNRGVNAVDAAQEICDVYGEDAMPKRTAQYWFSKFKNGIFVLKDATRSGRPSDFDEGYLEELLEDDPRQTSPELGVLMGCSHKTILRHLHSMGKVQKLGAWVPHVLSEANKHCRFTIAAGHLSRHLSIRGNKEQFLYRIVTGDEKWCLYVNMRRRKQWVSPGEQATPLPKQDLHPQKTMLCVWWDWKGVIYWELLENNQTVDKKLYVAQMYRLNDAILLKRPDLQGKVILLHDNARPHVAKIVKIAIKELEWEILLHPPYSPDIAPSDYHLFRSMSNQMRGVTFSDEDDLKAWLDNFLKQWKLTFIKEESSNLLNGGKR